ncbi:uracil-DNA glycosylase [Aquibacillus albus]|uniref:Uracil-DNA glycosylase n=1 Tax=Aquibacillus albus TaxID=1168171 RepID=A0ABS2N3K2_9BACI|nr:uracil-DNA glycosylase [Aquibacillus albus]MBM7572505.1 uracil-DNA glycosylase [Aquibacillus albus]
MILPNDIHPSWSSFLTKDRLHELKDIEREIGNTYNPTNPKDILRFLSTDLYQTKVIWLGQDVYPAKGIATGRAFEVGHLTSWMESFRQVSVKNIIRLIHKNYNGINHYEQIKRFEEIKQEIEQQQFPIKAPQQWFDSLEEQGVLFLNTSFTCEIGKANSHKHIWETFSKRVLRYISEVNPSIYWFLWGKEAKLNKQFISNGVFFESRHPMMCSKKYEDDFLKSSCFLNTWDEINWLG